MDVDINESGQERHPRAVDDMGLLGVGIGAGIGAADGRDPVALDDDVHRASGGGSLAIDDNDVPDDQPVVAPAVLDAAGLGPEARAARGRQDQGTEPEDGEAEFFHVREYITTVSLFSKRWFGVCRGGVEANPPAEGIMTGPKSLALISGL